MTNPVCTVMVGLPALGKSTRVTAMAEMDPDVFVYSTDNYIEQCAKINNWTYDQAFPEFIEPATKNMNEMLDLAVRSKQNIIWDQTNVGVGKRRKIINRMKQAGYAVNCECFIPPEAGHFDDLKLWKLRLRTRPGKTIPDDVVTSMYNNYVEPKLDEGFVSVTFWSMHGNMVDKSDEQ